LVDQGRKTSLDWKVVLGEELGTGVGLGVEVGVAVLIATPLFQTNFFK